MTRRPRIAVTLDTGTTVRRGASLPQVQAKRHYADQVASAGGTPLCVAPTDEAEVLDDLGDLMDGLVVTGGDFDLAPETYGERAEGRRLDTPKPDRTRFERTLLCRALDRGLPVLAVCGGMQLLNVVLGGTLLVDIASDRPDALDHEQPTTPERPDHPLAIVPDTPWTHGFGPGPWAVNSTHHQAIDRVADPLVVWGFAPDGIIEAVGSRDDPAVIGVQWHPELLDDPLCHRLYGALVAAARDRMV